MVTLQTADAPHTAVTFPESLPNGYEWFTDEVAFDPERHLALTEPEEVVTLADLGYSQDAIAETATAMAISTPFRLLSDEGADMMLATARRLRAYRRQGGNRIENVVRGGIFRSRWLRDLCMSTEVSSHLSRIYGSDVAPHPMGVHLGHLNYEPSEINTAVDKWHHDTLPLDYVMSVTDPTNTPGGRFEYFVGTKDEAAELRASGTTPSSDRVVAPDLPGPGWVVALHGNMVVHRGGALTEKAERITMVNGYVSLDPDVDIQSRSVDLMAIDDPEVLYYDWTRYAAWRAKAKLQAIIDEVDFGLEPTRGAELLQAAVADVVTAAQEMQGPARDAEHYE